MRGARHRRSEFFVQPNVLEAPEWAERFKDFFSTLPNRNFVELLRTKHSCLVSAMTLHPLWHSSLLSRCKGASVSRPASLLREQISASNAMCHLQKGARRSERPSQLALRLQVTRAV